MTGVPTIATVSFIRSAEKHPMTHRIATSRPPVVRKWPKTRYERYEEVSAFLHGVSHNEHTEQEEHDVDIDGTKCLDRSNLTCNQHNQHNQRAQ